MSIKELLFAGPAGAVLGGLIVLLLIALCLPNKKGEKVPVKPNASETNNSYENEKDVKIYPRRSLHKYIQIEKMCLSIFGISILPIILLSNISNSLPFESLLLRKIIACIIIITPIASLLIAFITFSLRYIILCLTNGQEEFCDKMFVFKDENFLLIEGWRKHLEDIKYEKFSTVYLNDENKIKLLTDKEDIVSTISLDAFDENAIIAILKEFEKHSKTIKANGKIDLSNIKNNQELSDIKNSLKQLNIKNNQEKITLGIGVRALIVFAPIIILFILIYNDNQQGSNKQNNSSSSIQAKKADYTFNEMYPWVRGMCDGFGCVIAELSQPGGKKKVADKYDGKFIKIEKYPLTSYSDNYDTIQYQDLEGLLDCKMTARESQRLQDKTKGKKGMVSIEGVLHIGKDTYDHWGNPHPYLQPCYFVKVYQCKGDEVGGALCLK